MKRELVLLGCLVAGLSAVFLLPDFKTAESALSRNIPKQLGLWETHGYEASVAEQKTLAKDTLFSKAACLRSRTDSFFDTGPQDRADMSIVMSGIDLANSIHRPERCMPAQGHNIYSSSTAMVSVPNGHEVPARRLLSKQAIPIDETGKSVISRETVTYYFFVGSGRITENHTKRTLLDIQDRLLKGEAQKWAYVSVSMWFNGEHGTPNPDLLSFDEADQKVRDLLGQLAEKNIDWSKIQSTQTPG
ncbi:EpsI family protein [Luteolibacter flavescens]|uniref:EpsI family protein n=1 Tax=Luteolibacter flavescens TaxID=1859460 RepID=A0ABT3FNV0_9BACT|nr:EpsI family protein [Luteolibacter flavescens]MCW1885142.1 EpsI family protein [Luteolibacter flavescens]